jgi:hypothetical protein
MKTRILSVIAAIGVAAFTTAVYADDHLATAVAAGGLTSDKQPFNIDNPGKGGEGAPGQGSPLSGEDHTTPASLTQEEAGHTLTTNPAWQMEKTAPSVHSNH